ncbi:MAG: TonB-dependent receptor plug domain-containing protein [Burkholderiales bacterium]|nr:TonB-dependent receptor plug domain-containing protein [Burkholderiales bacterium]
MQPHFRLTALTLAIAGAFSFSSMAYAQAQQATEEGNENTVTKDKDAHKKNDATDHRPVQQITISAGRTEMEERRQSTAAKMIFGREELDKNGDSTIGEILKRLPGVTIGGRPGRGGDIRMRGMGNGYTQILLNGERAPRGFSMDSLSPDQVERIEIIRGPVAEYSTQAIAGTINIVLRDEYKQKDTDIKISEAFEQGRSAPNISITKPGELGRLSYSLSASVFRRQLHDESDTYSLEKDANDQAGLIQDQRDQTNRRTTGIHFTPRLNYHFENGDTLTVQPFIMNARSTFNTESRINQTLGLPSPYAIASTTGDANTTFARAFGNWQHKLNGNGKLAVKFSGGVGKMDNSSLRYQYASDGAQVDRISDVSNTRDSSINTSGKYTQPFGEGHTLAAGWELESGKRSETRTSLDNGAPQFAESGDKSPVNIGHAVTRGIELEAKFQLQEFFPNAAAIDVRSNYSRFWSSVDDIIDPNNTLDQQPQQTANFGLDYRAAHLSLTVGGNINWKPAYVTQSSATQVNIAGMKRQLDLQVRLSANNVQASDYLSGTAVTTGGVNRIDYTSSKTFTTWTIRLEMKI